MVETGLCRSLGRSIAVNPEILEITRSFHLPKTTFNITHDLVPRMLGFFSIPSMRICPLMDDLPWSSHQKWKNCCSPLIPRAIPNSLTTSWLRAWGDAGTWHGTSGRPVFFTYRLFLGYILLHPHSPSKWDDQTASNSFLLWFLRWFFTMVPGCILEISHHFQPPKPPKRPPRVVADVCLGLPSSFILGITKPSPTATNTVPKFWPSSDEVKRCVKALYDDSA